jgi:hypothetical protein
MHPATLDSRCCSSAHSCRICSCAVIPQNPAPGQAPEDALKEQIELRGGLLETQLLRKGWYSKKEHGVDNPNHLGVDTGLTVVWLVHASIKDYLPRRVEDVKEGNLIIAAFRTSEIKLQAHIIRECLRVVEETLMETVPGCSKKESCKSSSG